MPSKGSIHPYFFGRAIHINAIKGVSVKYAKYFFNKEKERILMDCLQNPSKYMEEQTW